MSTEKQIRRLKKAFGLPIDAWSSGLALTTPGELACRAGCFGCCVGLFEISLPEAALVRAGVARLSPADREDVVRRARRIAEETAAAFPGDAGRACSTRNGARRPTTPTSTSSPTGPARCWSFRPAAAGSTRSARHLPDLRLRLGEGRGGHPPAVRPEPPRRLLGAAARDLDRPRPPGPGGGRRPGARRRARSRSGSGDDDRSRRRRASVRAAARADQVFVGGWRRRDRGDRRIGGRTGSASDLRSGLDRSLDDRPVLDEERGRVDLGLDVARRRGPRPAHGRR